jgi:Spx/MgsR family transcriptional regulator
MILYAYSKCSTCQKAFKYLEEHNISYTLKEIKENAPTVEELKMMLKHQGGNLKKLFNTSGDLYREMKLSEKLQDMPLDESLELLSQHGMLVKRPFLLGKNFGIIGFKEAAWIEKLQS